MKIRSLLTLVGLAISFAVPTFAQQTNTPDPKLREALDAFLKKEDEAYLNGDAAALAALYTEDAVLVNDSGPVYGREAIEKWYADLFKHVHFMSHVLKADQDSPRVPGTAGNEVWTNGEWSITIKGDNFGPLDLKGFWGAVKVRDGDTFN